MNPILYPIILAGGASSRLWPLSNNKRPKWGLRLFGERNLLQEAWLRACALSDSPNHFIVAGQIHGDLIRESLPGFTEDNLLLEPQGRDTAGAIAFALNKIKSRKPSKDSVLVIMPSDQLITDISQFSADIYKLASVTLRKQAVGLIGIVPRNVATGYGYVRFGELIDNNVRYVAAFKEKPNFETAKQYIASGEYCWNSGIFVIPFNVLMSEFETHLPEHASVISNFTNDAFLKLPKMSFDIGVIEKVKNIIMLKANFGWDDIGTWSSIGSHLQVYNGQCAGPDTEVISIESSRNVVIASNRKVALIGVEDLIIVESPDGLLVCRLDKDQMVKELHSKMGKI